MSDAITLTLRSRLDESLDVENVTADRLAGLDERQISALPAWLGRRAIALGEVFSVRGGRMARVRVEGDLHHVHGLAAGNAAGEVIVTGPVGARVAAAMSGGSVEVRGDAGGDAGSGMSGGVLRVFGNAGERVGGAPAGASKGMSGGEILVGGSAGADAAVRARRGLVVIGGSAGPDSGRAMIAGTLVVLGRVGANPGRGSQRGSIVAAGGVEVPSTYRYACTFEPMYLRFLLTYLRRRYGMPIDERFVTGKYRRYCGDAGDPGKGEILEWTAE